MTTRTGRSGRCSRTLWRSSSSSTRRRCSSQQPRAAAEAAGAAAGSGARPALARTQTITGAAKHPSGGILSRLGAASAKVAPLLGADASDGHLQIARAKKPRVLLREGSSSLVFLVPLVLWGAAAVTCFAMSAVEHQAMDASLGDITFSSIMAARASRIRYFATQLVVSATAAIRAVTAAGLVNSSSSNAMALNTPGADTTFTSSSAAVAPAAAPTTNSTAGAAASGTPPPSWGAQTSAASVSAAFAALAQARSDLAAEAASILKIHAGLIYGDPTNDLAGSLYISADRQNLLFGSNVCLRTQTKCRAVSDPYYAATNNGLDALVKTTMEHAAQMAQDPVEALTADNAHYKFFWDVRVLDACFSFNGPFAALTLLVLALPTFLSGVVTIASALAFAGVQHGPS